MSIFGTKRRCVLALGVLLFCALIYASSTYQYENVDRLVAACKNSGAGTTSLCYTNLIDRTLEVHGLSAALDVVERAGSVDPVFGQFCHSNMHDLGKATYDRYSKTKNIDLSHELSYCNFGFFHGFMEEMLVRTGSVTEAREFCDMVGAKSQNERAAVSNCYHGIGHGTTDGYDPRLWGNAEKMVAPGLALCHHITSDEELQRSCEMGAFNSIELMYADPKYKLNFGEDPYTLCKKPYDTNEKKACYLEMSVLALDLAGHDYKKAFDYLTTVEPLYRVYTVSKAALYAMSIQKADTAAILDTCRHSQTAYLHECIVGITQGLIVYGTPGRKYQGAIDFCKSTGLSLPEKHLCIDTILTSDVYTREEKRAVCQTLPEDMRIGQCTA